MHAVFLPPHSIPPPGPLPPPLPTSASQLGWICTSLHSPPASSAPSRLPLFTVSGGGDVMTTSPRHHPTAPPPPRLLSLLQAPPIKMDGAYSPLLQGSLMTNMSPSPSVIVITRAAPFCRLHLIFKVT